MAQVIFEKKLGVATNFVLAATLFCCSCSNEQDREHFEASSPDALDTVIQSVTKIWQSFCEEGELKEDHAILGEKLIEFQFRSLDVDESWLLDHANEIDSLARSQFCNEMTSRPHHKIAFIGLCIEAAVENDGLDHDIKSVQQHEQAVDLFIDAIKENIRSCLGGRVGFEEAIEAEAERAREMFEFKLSQLKNNAIYPGYRKPWTPDDWNAVLKRAEVRSKASSVFRSTSAPDAKDYYLRRLRVQCNSEVKSHLEFISFLDVVPLIDHPRVQESFLWTTENQSCDLFDKSGRWPIVIWLQPRE